MSLSFEDANLLRIMSMYPAFVYDEKRKFNQLCLVFKMIGFVFYSRTAVICVNDKLFPWFCTVSCMMLVSICNTLRYEYAFYKVYGMTFQSIDAFKEWKTKQKPHIKTVLDCIEFLIKVVYLYKSFPLTFGMYDENDDKKFSECVFSGTLLKLHIMVIMAGYSIIALLFMCLYTDIVYRRMWAPRQPRDAMTLNSAVNQMNAQNATVSAVQPIAVIIDNETECCICLEKNDKLWITTRCTHSFHATCVAEWMRRNPSCPVCRTNIIQTV
jgi:hypothetical protein